MGFLIMEPADTPPMSGSNSICVATVLLDTGMVPMIEPITEFDLEAPGGLVHIRAYCKDGEAECITVTNVASFVDRRDAVIVVPGIDSPLTVDTAYGGDSFVIVDTSQLLALVLSASPSPSPTPSSFSSDGEIKLIPSQAKELAELGMKITKAANEQLGFRHPDNPEWKHVSFCQFTGPLTRDGHQLKGTNAVAIRPGKIDRSPTGTGCSARMALLHARGDMALEDEYVADSIIGSTFSCKIQSTTVVGKDRRPAIFPTITGRAWITGTHQHTLDPTDPFPQGYRLSDTWPMAY